MMVEWRLEQESKNTEKVQYIGNGKVETEMWSGISEVIWRSWRVMISCQRSQGLVGVWGNGSVVSES